MSGISISGLFKLDDLKVLPDFQASFTEELGFGLPILTFSFKINSFIKFKIDEVEVDTEITVKCFDEETKWKIVHHSMPDEEHINVICLIDKLDYINIAHQSSFEGTSIEAISSIETLEINVLDVETDDKQIWLQDNINDRDFLINTLLHSNLKDDHLIYYVDIQGNFNIGSYNDFIKEKTHTLGTKESDLGIYQVLIESVPTSFRIKSQSSQFVSNQELYADSYLQNMTTDTNDKTFRVSVECGNTHEMYEKSYNLNNHRFSLMYHKLLSVIINNDRRVRPLDCIEILDYPIDHKANDKPKLDNKKYIVSKVETTDDSTGISQKVWFCKIKE